MGHRKCEWRHFEDTSFGSAELNEVADPGIPGGIWVTGRESLIIIRDPAAHLLAPHLNGYGAGLVL